mmetsp:Transcript_78749/g.222633  ORF Transcript_78749/g.222633 Transcript_78749/m.222633 type:complete len:93 (-) Transcript_78749:268-546(-)
MLPTTTSRALPPRPATGSTALLPASSTGKPFWTQNDVEAYPPVMDNSCVATPPNIFVPPAELERGQCTYSDTCMTGHWVTDNVEFICGEAKA